MVGLYFIFGLISYVVMGFALMTLANKTGHKDKNFWGWIPILNVLLMLEIAELPLWYILLLLVPCVNVGVIIYTWWRIAEKRGKPGPAAIGLIVPVVGFFIVLWIAFSD
ncbi:MAG: hypothetical protein JNM34_04135 [Chthonomonadaceae bacterium]|nr:hypothetical protein [Chthonomonadaceae bacterium]